MSYHKDTLATKVNVSSGVQIRVIMKLDKIAEREKRSLSEIIARAIDFYLSHHEAPSESVEG